MPMLGTGAAGFEFERGARLVCETVRDCEPTRLTNVRVIASAGEQFGRLVG